MSLVWIQAGALGIPRAGGFSFTIAIVRVEVPWILGMTNKSRCEKTQKVQEHIEHN